MVLSFATPSSATLLARSMENDSSRADIFFFLTRRVPPEDYLLPLLVVSDTLTQDPPGISSTSSLEAIFSPLIGIVF